jgi:hypothetical protein
LRQYILPDLLYGSLDCITGFGSFRAIKRGGESIPIGSPFECVLEFGWQRGAFGQMLARGGFVRPQQETAARLAVYA